MGEIKEEMAVSAAIKSKELQIRQYQIKIANECTDKNSLVVIPTGLGKTIIGVLVASKVLERFPPKSKIIVLAPTRPLINQHFETFIRFLKVPKENCAILTGMIKPEDRSVIFNNTQLLFYTPQTLRNDLVHKKYTLNNTALIIFDEAHHTSGDYAYAMIADEFIDHNPDGIILGLTASPGSSKNKIKALCENLHIPLENIHIRTRTDDDVKTYLKSMDIYKIGVDITPLMEDVYKLITVVLEERLHYLSQVNFLEARGNQLYTKIIRKDLLKLNTELVSLLKDNGDKTGIYSALSINAQALILYHMLELVEQQGLNVLLDYFNKLHKDAKKKNSSKANKILASDSRLNRIYLELKKNADFSPENLFHPKYNILKKILLEELQRNPTSRILVFVKLRNSVKTITNKLKDIKLIRPIRFVGQATKSQDDKGLSQKRQIEILEEFKKGIYNTLIGTNVAEEGLDIAECDLVIFYDVVASEIRYIQRKGRTARHRQGKVVILYSKKTRDEIYLRIALSKLKRMNVNLKEPHHSNNQLIPDKVEIRKEPHKDTAHIQSFTPQRKRFTKQHQSKLTGFIDQKPQEYPIKISKFLPMKFGLRKRFQDDNIAYGIGDSDLHIIIYNKVLIQIYNPEQFNSEKLMQDISDFTQISSLIIIIFDFIDFKESIEGEKRILKRNIQAMAKKNHIQAITIDNEEELYFIIKNIIENPN